MAVLTRLIIASLFSGVAMAAEFPQSNTGSAGQAKQSTPALVFDIKDWKEPPKNIPWSEIVTIKSPFETYKAVWDQDYQGRSCLISCNFYDGFISRWTGDQLAVAEFSSYCLSGICRKNFRNIPYGIEISVNGEVFSLSGSEGLFVLNAKVRRAIQSSSDSPKIAVRLGGNNAAIYNIGDKSARSIKRLITDEAREDTSVQATSISILLSPAIKRSELVQPVIKRSLPGVAEISTPRGKGTGFVIDRRGLLLTNRHVVGRFPEVDVRFNDNQVLRAKVVGRTADLDIALLEIVGSTSKTSYPALPLCVRKAATVGEDIVVIGNPLGLQATTTRGIVSGIRNEDGSTMLQIDAPINPGNSGGPIVNYSGEVVGIVTAKMVALGVEGIGFGIGLPSALESLGVKISGPEPASQQGSGTNAVNECGNYTL